MLESTPSARKRSWVSRDLGCSGRGEAGITGMGNTWLPCWPEAPPPRLSVYSLADDTFLANLGRDEAIILPLFFQVSLTFMCIPDWLVNKGTNKINGKPFK